MTDAGVSELDQLLPAQLRATLEERFWRPIEQATTLEALADDPAFLADPVNHPALFSDHGVVHARDIAASFLTVADIANGCLLARRDPERQTFLAAYGILITYLHDVGMHDQTRAGRSLHAVYAAHVAFGRDLDDVVPELLADGPVAARLHGAQDSAPLAAPLEVVLRELLALTMAHSKSAVPAALLDDRPALRRLLQRAVLTDLEAQRAPTRPAASDDGSVLPTANGHWYEDAAAQSFAWLVAEEGAHERLADDVIDAVRVLRAADALRQRGTSLKTTAGYEIFVDARSGQAVFSLRPADNSKVFLLRGDSPKSAGEANLREASLTAAGNLRVAFHRGGFLDAEAQRYAEASTAHVLSDIVEDVLTSFDAGRLPRGLDPPAVAAADIQIQLERPGDDPAFAERVAQLLAAAHPELAARIVPVADLEGLTPQERDRFHRGVAVAPDSEAADELLEELARRGTRVEGIDRAAAFTDVRRVQFRAGEVVVALGEPSQFVYVATGPGLRVHPGGGYAPAAVSAWVPVGTTGVIRRAERNAQVSVDRDVEVLMIPGESYVRVWFRPYEADELARVLAPVGS
jgi:hypothetical protein